ncbi:MAG: trigger factor [Pseudomonadota bacterium]
MEFEIDMEVIEKQNEGLSRAFTVKVSAADLDARLMTRLEEIKPQVNLKGFRPGKAPMSFLKQRFGKGVMGEIVQDLINEQNDKMLEERNLRPAQQPHVQFESDMEKVASGASDLEYEVQVEILPEFEPADVSGMALERKVADIPEEDVEAALNELAAQQRTYAARDDGAASEDGDALDIDFVGRVDGEEFDGGKGEDVRIVLGSKTFIPGFEDQLVGAKAGDSKTISVTFPEDYGADHLSGKDAEFDVTVKTVSAPEEATIDDEFAKKLGVDDLAALKETLQKRLESDYAQLSRSHIKRALLDKLDDAHDFELPKGMVDAEFDQIWKQVEASEKDEEDKDKSEDELKEEYRKIAERRVRLGLVLAEIGRKADIDVPQEDLTRAMVEQARQYPGQEKQIFEFYQQNPNAMAQLRAPIYEEKVVDYILELADVTETKVTKEELMKDPDETA